MVDSELEELRKKVKDKEQQKKIDDEKYELMEKLEIGTLRSRFKKVGKSLFKRLMK